MIRSAVTVSLVEQARGGPFVFWDGIEDAWQRADELGFDCVEIFAPGPDAVDRSQLKGLIEKHDVAVAAVGTGAGMVVSGLSLTDPDEGKRKEAVAFIQSMIDFGAEFSAPAIIGSMQGRWGGDISKAMALEWLAEGVNELGDYAAQNEVPLIYEPLNRYETNLFNTLSEGAKFLSDLSTTNVKLLADLFHMNIEEADVAQAIFDAGAHIGHVHFVDSNRKAAGLGHTDFEPIVAALKESKFDGIIAVEAFPLPDSMTAATKTIEAYNKYFGSTDV